MLGFYSDKGSLCIMYRKQKNGKKITLWYYPGFSDELWNKDTKRFKDEKLQKQFVKVEKAIYDVLEKNDPFKLDIKSFGELIDENLKQTPKQETSFYDYCERYYEYARKKTSARRSQCFRTCINKLKEYAPNLTFEQINRKFYDDFIDHMMDAEFGPNYIGSVVRDFKRILNWAADNGEYTDLAYKKFKKPKEDVFNIYLSEEEIERIYQLQITPELIAEAYNERKADALAAGEQFNEVMPETSNLDRKIKALNRSRLLFVIGCWTGLRVENYLKIDPQIHVDLKDGYIHAVANKMGPKLQIPLHRIVRTIIEKDGLPRSISAQNLNYHIKELGQMAKINKLIVFARTKGHKRIEYAVPKYKLIKTHTARRSFASNLLLRGIPKQYIMAVTGHRTESSFNKYIAAVQKDILTAKLKDYDVWG